MSAFDIPPADSPQKDYRDMQVTSEALVTADPGELAQIAATFGWTPERVALESEFAKLRASVVGESSAALDARRATSPRPDNEELLLGAYREALESQVRAAVFAMREKGYNTYESGFNGFGASQRIGLTDPQLENFSLPEDLVRRWQEQGMSIVCMPDGIRIDFAHMVPLAVIERAWNEIAEMVPDKGAPAGPSPFAERFAKRTGESLKRGN